MKPHKTYRSSLQSSGEQTRRGEELMQRYLAYAIGIGCSIGEGAARDCIECAAEQADMLNAWWEENTR